MQMDLMVNKINEIMEDHKNSENHNEVVVVSETSRAIAIRLRMHQFMSWTIFPEEFEKCKTDAQLYKLLYNLDKWIDEFKEGGTLCDIEFDEPVICKGHSDYYCELDEDKDINKNIKFNRGNNVSIQEHVQQYADGLDTININAKYIKSKYTCNGNKVYIIDEKMYGFYRENNKDHFISIEKFKGKK